MALARSLRPESDAAERQWLRRYSTHTPGPGQPPDGPLRPGPDGAASVPRPGCGFPRAPHDGSSAPSTADHSQVASNPLPGLDVTPATPSERQVFRVTTPGNDPAAPECHGGPVAVHGKPPLAPCEPPRWTGHAPAPPPADLPSGWAPSNGSSGCSPAPWH